MAVAFVQSASNAAKLVSSLAKAFTSNNTSGNMLVVSVGVWQSGAFATPTIADTKGNTWKLLLSTPRQFASGQSAAYLFVAYNCGAGANTVTVTVGSNSDIDIAIHEYSGCATVTARDQIAAGSRSAVSSILAGTVQTRFANEVVFSFAYDQTHGAQTFTPSAGWTAREQTTNPDGASSKTYDQLVSSTGSFTNTISVSGGISNGIHAIIASFADSSTTDNLVQTGKNSGTGTSLTVAFPANNGAGNLLLLAIGRWVSGIGTLGTISSVTDSQGNTWVAVDSTALSSHSTHGESKAHLYACASCAAGANTITVTVSGSQDISLIAHEYSLGTINADVAVSQPTGAVVVTSVASGDLNVDSGLAFTLAYNQSNAAGNYSDVSGTGWKQRVNQSSSTGETLSTFDQIVASLGTIESTITISVATGSFGLHVIVAANGQTIRPIMEFLIS